MTSSGHPGDGGIEKRRDVTGMILVGGKSRRMGTDKAFIRVGGVPLFERVLSVFRESFSEILLVGDRGERFAGYQLRVVPDIYPGSSLGGLYTGLYHAGTERVFVSPCDMPFPSAGLLRYLCSLSASHDAVVPQTGRGFEPLFAVYAKKCLKAMKELLDGGNLRVFDLYRHVDTLFVSGAGLAPFDPGGRAFVNVNTPEELESLSEP